MIDWAVGRGQNLRLDFAVAQSCSARFGSFRLPIRKTDLASLISTSTGENTVTDGLSKIDVDGRDSTAIPSTLRLGATQEFDDDWISLDDRIGVGHHDSDG